MEERARICAIGLRWSTWTVPARRLANAPCAALKLVYYNIVNSSRRRNSQLTLTACTPTLFVAERAPARLQACAQYREMSAYITQRAPLALALPCRGYMRRRQLAGVAGGSHPVHHPGEVQQRAARNRRCRRSSSRLCRRSWRRRWRRRSRRQGVQRGGSGCQRSSKSSPTLPKTLLGTGQVSGAVDEVSRQG